MALQPGIILSGQTPDIIGTLARSTQAAAQRNELTRRNALEQLYRTQGAGIAAGDPAAVNALAGYDPQAAMQVQDAITQRQRQATADSRSDQEWQWRVEEYAASKSAAERAAEAAKIEESVKMGLSATSPQQWDAMMAQMGADDLIGQFENRRAIANRYLSVAEILKGQQGPAFRRATPEEAASYGAAAGQFGEDGRFYPINPPSGTSFTTNPDGTVSFTQGAGVGGLSVKPGTAPAGYSIIPSPSTEGGVRMVPTPGGPAEREIEATAAKADRVKTQSRLKLGTQLQSLNLNIAEVENGGLPVTGAIGDLRRTAVGRALTGNNAFDFENRTRQITDAAAFAEIQNMRDNSPTGGAVGQLTDAERQAIGNAVTGLNSSTSNAEYLRAAKTYRNLALDIAYGEGRWEFDAEGNVIAKDATNPAAGSGSQPPAAVPDDLTPEERQYLGLQ